MIAVIKLPVSHQLKAGFPGMIVILVILWFAEMPGSLRFPAYLPDIWHFIIIHTSYKEHLLSTHRPIKARKHLTLSLADLLRRVEKTQSKLSAIQNVSLF